MGLTVPAPSLSPTPSSRMHSANFTAFWWVAAALLLPLLPVPAGALEPTRDDHGKHGKAASGRSVLLMASPRVWCCVDNGFSAERAGHCRIPGSLLGSAQGGGSRGRWRRGAGGG